MKQQHHKQKKGTMFTSNAGQPQRMKLPMLFVDLFSFVIVSSKT